MVSVIIPNYNHAPYLTQRIDSVLNQTFQDFEVILLDDCSTDNSRDIIENYRNQPKISHIVYNKSNSGTTFKQWEKGMSLAKGDYIWIAESDDWAEFNFLEEIMNSILTNKSNICFSQSKIIDENNKTLGKKPQILKFSTVLYDEFLVDNLLYGNSIYNASMTVFEKKYVSNTIWEELSKLKFCGDWLFWVEFITKSRGVISEVKEPLNNFRVHSSNVSGKSEVKGLTFLEGFAISERVLKIFNKRKFPEFDKIWFDKWYSYRHYYNFTKEVNFKIFQMFLINRPNIALLEFKRLFRRGIGKHE